MSLSDPSHRRSMVRRCAVAALSLLAAACGSGEVVPAAPDISLNVTTTEAAVADGAGDTTTTTAMPGVALEDAVSEGTVLVPFGVEFGESIEIREFPALSFDVVATVAVDGEIPEIVSTGAARTITGGFWWEVTVNGTTGWVERSNVAVFGEPTEILDEVLAELEIPPRDLDALGRLIGRSRFGDARTSVAIGLEPEGLSQVSGVVTVDVIGLAAPDEGARGERLVISADIFRINGGAAVRSTIVNSIQRFPVCEIDVDPSGNCR